MTPGEVAALMVAGRDRFAGGEVGVQEFLYEVARAVEALALVVQGDPLGEGIPAEEGGQHDPA